MQKTILFGAEAKQKIMDGINKCVNAVKVTLGSNGRNVIIKHSFISPQGQGVQHYPPICTKDGISVLRSITLTDPIENIGCDFVKEASQKTMDEVGDATTTTAVLFQSIVDEGLKQIANGANPMVLKKNIDESVEYVSNELETLASPVAGSVEKIKQIATVSANNDSSIGDLIGEAFEKIGEDGVITIGESKTSETYIDIIEGFQFEKGYIHPNFINNNKDKCELETPYILIYEKKLSLTKPLEPILQEVITQDKPLLIICDDADGEALATLVMNTVQKRIKCCIVRCPSFGDGKRTAMEDIAMLTSGTYISEEKGYSLDKLRLGHLGKADKVIIGKDNTIIIGGKGDAAKIEDTINNLKMDMANSDVAEKEQLERRIAKLKGGVAVLYVGAATETEMKEKKDRVDDAVRATKAAIAEGVVAGGGTAFIRVLNTIEDNNDKKFDVIKVVLKMPLTQLCLNAGIETNEIIPKVIAADGNFGFNAKKEVIEDLMEVGIIDPVKALRCALQNAASSAGSILTSECLIVDTF